jgi:DNA ligase (NAD+)
MYYTEEQMKQVFDGVNNHFSNELGKYLQEYFNKPDMNNITPDHLRQVLRNLNMDYRLGNPQVSDADYDEMCDQLRAMSPHDIFFQEIGQDISESPRKEPIPIPMKSMEKIKTTEEYIKWLVSRGIPEDTEMILTGKYDGLSLSAQEWLGKAWTRGDGTYGQRSDIHFAKITSVVYPAENVITFGEAIMKREVFVNKYAELYENPRNLVAGLLNKDEATDALNDVDYVRYGMVNNNPEEDFIRKSQQLDALNKFQPNKVMYTLIKASYISEEVLKNLFSIWSKVYELDGIIIEVNDLKIQEQLGRERNGNPAYARAYKGDFEEVKETVCTGYSLQISKQGQLMPVVHVEPVRLNGVTVSKVTGNNMRFMHDNKIGKGSVLKIKRSGMVIPLIMENLKPVEPEMPTCCPACGSENLGWNDTNVHLMCFNEECSGQQLQRMIAFFSILNVENVSEGVCTQFYEAGFDTIHKVLNMTKAEMEGLDRFGKRKAEIVHKAIHSKMTDIPLSKLQHATGLFKGLGSKKLLLLEHFESKPTVEEITQIEGFSDTLANSYINAYDKFYEFIQGLPLTYKRVEKKGLIGTDLEGMSFAFTGVRRKDLEPVIEGRGGKIASGVSKNLTYLVIKDASSTSSKTKKATELGVKVLTVEQLEDLLNFKLIDFN